MPMCVGVVLAVRDEAEWVVRLPGPSPGQLPGGGQRQHADRGADGRHPGHAVRAGPRGRRVCMPRQALLLQGQLRGGGQQQCADHTGRHPRADCTVAATVTAGARGGSFNMKSSVMPWILRF